MAKKEKLGIKQTKGYFQLRGKVIGIEKALKEQPTKNDATKSFRSLNIGIQTSETNTIYITMNGTETNEVTFQMYDKEKKQNHQQKVSWEDRETFKKEGYTPMFGIKVGITQKEKGKNELLNLFPFDACGYLADNLKDGDSVYIRGDIKFESFESEDKEGNKQVKKSVKLVPTQFYKTKTDIDFKADDFVEMSEFVQDVVFLGVEKDKESKTDRFEVETKIVNYDGIENAQFVMVDKKLAKLFKDRLKAYNSIKVTGLIKRILLLEEEVEETEEEDAWGEQTQMSQKVVKHPSVTEMIIIGADPNTLDRETYSEAILTKKQKAKEDFGDDSWGKEVSEEDEENPWGDD